MVKKAKKRAQIVICAHFLAQRPPCLRMIPIYCTSTKLISKKRGVFEGMVVPDPAHP